MNNSGRFSLFTGAFVGASWNLLVAIYLIPDKNMVIFFGACGVFSFTVAALEWWKEETKKKILIETYRALFDGYQHHIPTVGVSVDSLRETLEQIRMANILKERETDKLRLNCKYLSNIPFVLKCAVNPSEPCQSCTFYKEKDES